MEISRALKELHEAYKDGNPSLGYVSRASILHYIMKYRGLDPERKLFSFKDNQGNRVIGLHCIVLLNGSVYDTNIEESKNPIEFEVYTKMKKESSPKLELVWENWTDSHDKNNPIDFLWNYSARFNEGFKNEVRLMMEKEYEGYLEKNPHLKKFNQNLVD